MFQVNIIWDSDVFILYYLTHDRNKKKWEKMKDSLKESFSLQLQHFKKKNTLYSVTYFEDF